MNNSLISVKKDKGNNLAISTGKFNIRNIQHESTVCAWYVFPKNEYKIFAYPITVSPFSEGE